MNISIMQQTCSEIKEKILVLVQRKYLGLVLEKVSNYQHYKTFLKRTRCSYDHLVSLVITHHVCQDSSSQNVFQGLAIPLSPGNLLELQNIGPHHIPTESESTEFGLSTVFQQVIEVTFKWLKYERHTRRKCYDCFHYALGECLMLRSEIRYPGNL